MARKKKKQQVYYKFGSPKNVPKPDPLPKTSICPNCHGDGGATGHCYKCDGTGWVASRHDDFHGRT